MNTARGARGIPPTPRPGLSRVVIRWRRRRLREAGYDELSAYRMAGDGNVDIHEKVLVKEGPHAARGRRPDHAHIE